MIPRSLISQIESHAAQLMQDVLDNVARDPRTANYAQLPESEMRQAVQAVLENLGEWLSSRRAGAIVNFYRKVGRKRRHSGIRVSEMFAAFGLVKRTLQDFIRKSMLAGPEEIAMESELILAVDEFFDSACYGAALGHEDAETAASSDHDPAPEVSAAYAARAKAATIGVEEWDPTSRAGDVGEHGG